MAEWPCPGGDVFSYAPELDRLYQFGDDGVTGFRCLDGRCELVLLRFYDFAATCYESRTGKLYCLGDPAGTVTSIDPATGDVLAAIAPGLFGEETWPLTLEAAPGRLYVGCERGVVRVLDARTDTVGAAIELGSECLSMQPVESASAVLCATADSGVAIIDTRTDSVRARVAAGGRVITFCPDNNRASCYAAIPGTVLTIDAAGGSITARIHAGLATAALALSPRGDRLFCADEIDSSLYVIDIVRDTVAARIGLPGRPVDLCVDSLDNKLYVACDANDTLYAVDGRTLAIVARIPGAAAGEPGTLVYFAGSNSVYSGRDDSIVVVDCVQDRRVAGFGGGFGELSRPVACTGIGLICVGEDRDDNLVVIHDDRQPRWAAKAAPVGAPVVVADGRFVLPGTQPGWLFDLSGRRYSRLLPGANDVSGLLPGVYFVKSAGLTRKLVVAR